jgi:hypothetical protein
MVSITVMSMPWPCAQREHFGDFGVVEALERDGVDLDLQARRPAPPMPSMTLARSPQRVIALELVGSSVSIDTLMRRTPQSWSSEAKLGQLRAVGGQRQFLQRAGFDVATELRSGCMMFLRTSGSPPVRRSRHALLDKNGAQPVELLQREKILLGQEGHVFRHAIGAAEIAAVGHRNAQIVDGRGRRGRS